MSAAFGFSKGAECDGFARLFRSVYRRATNSHTPKPIAPGCVHPGPDRSFKEVWFSSDITRCSNGTQSLYITQTSVIPDIDANDITYWEVSLRRLRTKRTNMQDCLV